MFLSDLLSVEFILGNLEYVLMVCLLGSGLWLTIRLGFIQFRKLGHGIAVTSGKYDDPDAPGDVSHFQALTTALSATVGIGNIAGVAIAIHWGGPGAIFWMWVTAILGAALKYSEVTLAQHYRINITAEEKEKTGSVSGGPMHYIEQGLGKRWRPVALFFAAALMMTAFINGNAIQSNTIAGLTWEIYGISPLVTGALTAVVVALVIIGGITRIGKVTGFLVPAMAVLYLGGGLVILGINYQEIGPALKMILSEAFQPTAGVAGTGTGVFIQTLLWGIRRGLFSNEAGQGSAPIAHSAAKTEEPVSEGVVALLEPFIDTIIICSITALVILATGVWNQSKPTEILLSSKNITYQRLSDNEESELPEAIIVQNGLSQTDTPNAVRMAWHDVAIDSFFYRPRNDPTLLRSNRAR